MKDLDDGRQKESAIAKNAVQEAGRGNGKGASLKGAVEDHEEAMVMRDLLRRSITALCALAKNDNRTVSERLNHFKKIAQKESAAEEIEKSLMALKEAIFESEDSDVKPALEPVRAQDRSQGPVARTVAKVVIDELQAIFLRLIAEFDQDLGEEYAARVAVLREKSKNPPGSKRS